MSTEQMPEPGNWQQTVNKLTGRIAEITPEWTDYNVHDPGITLLELLAWMQENQAFHMEQVSRFHRRKFLKLLGITCRCLKPAETFLCVNAKMSLEISKEASFFSGDICFEAAQTQVVTEGIFDQFLTVSAGAETRLKGEWMKEGRGLSLYPFGKTPSVGDQFLICLKQVLPHGKRHRLYVETSREYAVHRKPVEESEFGVHGFYPLGEILIEYRSTEGWRQVETESDHTYGLIQDGSICFSFQEAMDSEKPDLRLTLTRSDYLLPPWIARISLAMILVKQKRTKKELPVFIGTGLPGQQFNLEEAGIYKEEFTLVVDEQSGKLQSWTLADDFDCSSPADRHFTLEEGILQFGDCIHGMAPKGHIFVTRLVTTLGSGGNIKADTIRHTCIPEVSWVTNESDVTGGQNEESESEAFHRYLSYGQGQAVRRAVTFEDYNNLVKEIPGLMLEDCRAYEAGVKRRTMMLAVMPYSPYGPQKLNAAYEKNLYRYLEDKRLLGTRIFIVSPEYLYLTVICELSGNVQYRHVLGMVEEAVQNYINELGLGDGISYGKLYGTIDHLPCVRQIKFLELNTENGGKRNERGDLLVPPNGRIFLKSVECSVITEMEEKM